jgi:hypothetical protein
MQRKVRNQKKAQSVIDQGRIGDNNTLCLGGWYLTYPPTASWFIMQSPLHGSW